MVRHKRSPDIGQHEARQSLAVAGNLPPKHAPANPAKNQKAARATEPVGEVAPELQSTDTPPTTPSNNFVPLSDLPDADLVTLANLADPKVVLSDPTNREVTVAELQAAGVHGAQF